MKSSYEELENELKEVKEELADKTKKVKKWKERTRELEKKQTSATGSSGEMNVQMYEFQKNEIKKLEFEKEELKKEKESEIEKLNQELEEAKKEATRAKEGLDRILDAKPETFGDVAKRVKDEFKEAIGTGVSEGNRAIPIAGGVVGGLLGYGTGTAAFATETGMFAINKLFGGDKDKISQELGRQLREVQEQKENLEKENKTLGENLVKKDERIKELEKSENLLTAKVEVLTNK